MNWNETRLYKSHLLGIDEYVDGKHRVRNVTIRDFLDDMGLIDQIDLNEFAELFTVVWYYDGGNGGDIYIDHIYDNDTGIVYWEDKDEYTNQDEDLVNALLMYGNLQKTIDQWPNQSFPAPINI